SLVKQKKRLTTAELMDQLTAGMGLSMMPGGTYREALDRLRKFVEEWQKKSDTRLLPEFLEYFEYFQEAGGKLNFENEPEGDAVQLMTVHAAKGLEFPHVYVVRLVDRSFPAKEKEPELEFPVELLKDVLPQTQYHIQEERRLFYVALTRAKRSLTLSTVINKWSKQSIFVHDVLDDPRIKKEDVHQLAPQAIPVEEDRQEASADALRMELFGPDALNVRAFSKIGEWGRTYRPPLYDPLQLSASAIEYFERCPQAYLFASQWGLRGGPQATMTFGSVMHLAVKEFVAMVSQSRRVSFEDLEGIYQREWRTGAKAGFRDEVHEEEYKKAGLEQLRMFYDSYTQAPSDVVAQEKKFELPMENNIVVEGRIDQINRLNKTEVEIVDYKTGTPKDEKASKRSLQLSIYALAVKDVFEWDPAKLVFHNFSNNERAESARTKKDLEKAQTKVQEVAGDIRAANFPAKAGFICNYCDFRLICPEHQE
ncbi:MAG: ATP-dependent helicase, partial [Acidobacteria bacterium]|nr:ATP-dependent helicase [Acidobacteriota bacterium]